MLGTPVTFNYKVDIASTTSWKNLGVAPLPATTERGGPLHPFERVSLCETYTLYSGVHRASRGIHFAFRDGYTVRYIRTRHMMQYRIKARLRYIFEEGSSEIAGRV